MQKLFFDLMLADDTHSLQAVLFVRNTSSLKGSYAAESISQIIAVKSAV